MEYKYCDKELRICYINGQYFETKEVAGRSLLRVESIALQGL
jgi:hypothetical protein